MRRFPDEIARRLLVAAMLAFAADAAAATGLPEVADYDACLALARERPETAAEAARRWRQAGGGAAARHCEALAVIAAGAERRGAELLLAIAAEERALPTAVRAEILVTAGEVLLDLGEEAAARRAAEAAAALAPEAPAPAVLRARIAAAAGVWDEAEAAIGRALELGGPDPQLIILRASARIHRGDLVGARGDLAWAGETAPDLPELWLERGRLAAAEGARDAARRAFLRAIELDRDGPVGEAARRGIQEMELGG